MPASPSEPSAFVDAVTTAIIRRVDHYAELVDAAKADGRLERAEEITLLDRFEHYTADVLDRYPPPGPRNRESLAFVHLYREREDDTSAEDRCRALLVALMAAEVESRGPLRLTQAQNGRLAAILERIGAACGKEGLLLHAALAFERAAGIYLLLSDNAGRDRCLYERARFRQKSTGPGLAKALLAVSWTLCGYGYKPYRLLAWVAIQLVVFSLGVALTVPGSVWHGIYLSVTNYLDPQGSDELSATAQMLLVTESYVSAVSLSVFFALLVHRWFRI
jgi:hypothetical protein